MTEPPERKDFARPWESDDKDDTEGRVVPLPGLGDSPEDQDEQPLPGIDVDDGSDDLDWLATDDDSDLDLSVDYTAATTQEYIGLAEEIRRAEEEEWQQQAVAAHVPGVDTGLVGFEDVSGRHIGTEEDYEALEQAATSDLAMRIGSGVVIFGLFLGCLLLGGPWFATFVVLVMVVSLGELYATMRSAGHKPLALFGLLAMIAMGIGAYRSGVGQIGIWAAVASAITILFVSIAPRRNPLADASVTVLGLGWVGLLAFAIPIAKGPAPLETILFIVITTAINDTGAFFVGRSFGRTKMAPNLSPNKSWEGFVGGLLLSAIAASVMVSFPAWERFGLMNGLILAGVVSVVSPLGDIAESMVKRSIGVKDMGSVLPGHGGMLDRIDGLLLVLPSAYFALRSFGLL
ncbi:MAG: phosphatidate cytidylyltransferase [Actinomycetes bacterium]|jgi:phosphatidate cytidylyltransferase